MAKKREKPKAVELTPAMKVLVRLMESCPKTKAVILDAAMSGLEPETIGLAKLLLLDCSRIDPSVSFDLDCHSCVSIRRREAISALSSSEARSLFVHLFKQKPDAAWPLIAEEAATAFAYELQKLAEKKYHDYRQQLYDSRQGEAVKRCCLLDEEEIAKLISQKEEQMAKKRTTDGKAAKEQKEKEPKEKATKNSPGGGGGDKVAKALEGKTPKQMLDAAKDWGVDKDKLKKVADAIKAGTGAGLIRMRIGNMMRGVKK